MDAGGATDADDGGRVVSTASLAIDRSAATERRELDSSSWLDVTRAFVREPGALLDQLVTEAPWHESTVWRYEKHLVEPRLGAQLPMEQLPAAIRQAHLHLESRYRVRFDTPVLVRYRNGRDSVAPHRDREMRWLEDTVIAIAVLGEPRPFVIRPLGGDREPSAADIDVRPGNGDLLVMGGRFQNAWLHGVPKVPHATERVSVTWRWTSRRGAPDRSPSYSAPRNFSS